LTQRLEAVHLSEMLHHGQRPLLLGFTVVRFMLSEVGAEIGEKIRRKAARRSIRMCPQL